ncbi:phosphate ABC transporter permease subunit PstC [Archaeoglobus veneficus]|uniref:Phosphate transport system permease protein n=1 Tax=Archaeoglobus veneficus (strain DSM 11195 / SNP6) TaxID=693661 RepID=F2KSB4_ARCVS|nr:phosphate ABC transporter permease subunit PstC [Archaeoglobus veneficus]AEA46883.1 phosphate ABC transporter, inner membrane subunit PstC [Archaeoglobus veneficus SNP6]
MELKEKLLQSLFFISGISAIVILLAITAFIAATGVQFFQHVSITEIFSTDWDPTASPPGWGMLVLFAGTLYIAAIAMTISIPAGLMLAIYMSEVASSAVREYLKPAIESIAGIPTVVLGLFGIIFLAPFISEIFNVPLALNALNAGILVGFLAIPTIASISEDVLAAIPRDFRFASEALGATKWQTISRVVLPAGIGGIVAAIMLALGRVIGETMVVLMVAGNAKAMPHSIFDPVRPVTANIAIELPETVVGDLHYQALFAQGLLLLLITFVINLAADQVLERYRRRFGQ